MVCPKSDNELSASSFLPTFGTQTLKVTKMKKEMNNLEELHRLTEAVRQSGADIAPTYAEYIRLAFALTTGNRTVHLGTAFHLAEQCGVQVSEPQPPTPKLGQLGQLGSPQPSSHTHARTINTPPPPLPASEPMEEETVMDSPDPMKPLPTFPQDYEWPELIRRILAYGKRPQQRDVLFLGAVTALGATLAKTVRFLYDDDWYGPSLQTFVVAPSASGKGVLSRMRWLVEPFHRAIRNEVEKAKEAYRKEKGEYDTLGKKRGEREAPTPPPNRMFIIPANNSSTGMLENLIESGGVGIIIEAEADTVTAALATEYGNWSDTMRKVFEHGAIDYNRRTNHEYRYTDYTYLSLLLSGTPSQVRPLIPTAENGLFSRFTFYYMHSYRCWLNLFGRKKGDAKSAFRAMGEEWKRTVDGWVQRGVHELTLTDEQQEVFTDTFRKLYRRSLVANGDDMSSSVFRLAIIVLRIMSVIAMLRGLEDGTLIRPASDINADNLKDGIVTSWQVVMTEADFRACLALVEPLYLHDTHILSFVDTTRVASRGRADRERLLAAMPESFERSAFIAAGKEMGCTESTASSWLRDLKKAGCVVSGEKYGTYVKRREESA